LIFAFDVNEPAKVGKIAYFFVKKMILYWGGAFFGKKIKKNQKKFGGLNLIVVPLQQLFNTTDVRRKKIY
jgi:hypothetical protein